MTPEIPVIRKYRAEDREAVRRICCETALIGQPSSIFFDDDEVFADALTAYFTDYEPQSCFVAESQGTVVGYIIGARDAAAMEKVCGQKIVPGLLRKAWGRGDFFRKKNLRFLGSVIGSSLKGEFREPPISPEYPALLHINLSKGCRGLGTGGRLMQAYCDYLRAEKIPGVHLATMTDKAGRFFQKQGFSLLYTGRRTYWHYILGTDVPLYIYGMRLTDSGPRPEIRQDRDGPGKTV